MAVAVLPFIPSNGYYDFDTSLDDVPYKFVVRWNERDNVDPATGIARGSWHFSIYASDGTTIAEGLKIVTGTYIGRTRAGDHELFRKGVFAAIDTANPDAPTDPTFDNLGTQIEVRYYTLSDLNAEVYAL